MCHLYPEGLSSVHTMGGDGPSFEEWEAAERVRCGAGPYDKVVSIRVHFE